MSASLSRASEITVFAASSMADAVTEIGNTFMQQSGMQQSGMQQPGPHTVRYVFAASSTLARQVIAGAPAHVYISANAAWMHIAVNEGAIIRDTVAQIAGNRLVLIGTPGIESRLPDDLPAIITPDYPFADILGVESYSRLAIGDPTHVPAGQYARQSLERLGLWHSLSRRLAPMPDVRAVLNIVVRGETPLGIVYASDLKLTPAIRLVAGFPSGSHLPITYLAGLVKSGQTTAAQSFFSYLISPEAAQVFQHHGFSAILPNPG